MRIGNGYDVHRLVEGRTLKLGGVLIPFERGLMGHSDGDALLHSIIDALLGAAGLGDIGDYFPPGDEEFRGADSERLLAHVVKLIDNLGLTLANLDTTIIAEEPRLKEYIEPMRRAIASCIGGRPSLVNVKAKTNDGLGYIGEGNAIAALAVVLLEEPR